MEKDIIVKIEIIANAGPKVLESGFDFDEVSCIQTGIDAVRYVLFKEKKLVTTIHEAVPVVVYYERKKL